MLTAQGAILSLREKEKRPDREVGAFESNVVAALPVAAPAFVRKRLTLIERRYNLPA
jgi:hypothetical protein